MGLTRSHRPRLSAQFPFGTEKQLYVYSVIIFSCYVMSIVWTGDYWFQNILQKKTFSKFDSIKSFAFPFNQLNHITELNLCSKQKNLLIKLGSIFPNMINHFKRDYLDWAASFWVQLPTLLVKEALLVQPDQTIAKTREVNSNGAFILLRYYSN